VLQGEGKPVLVGRVEYPPLTPARYKAVKALVDAHARSGLTPDELAEAIPDINTASALRDLRRKVPEPWETVILPPGVKGGYRSRGLRWRLA
jgi:hypothetical protein